MNAVTFKRMLLALVLAVLLADTFAVRAERAQDLLLIANKADDSLTFVNATTLEPVSTIATGNGPHEVAVTPDGRFALVANYEGTGDTISVIDMASLTEIRRLDIDPYRKPHGLAAAADGAVFATVEGSGAVIRIDLDSMSVTQAVETRQQLTHMLALTPDGRKLYASNIVSGTVTVIDLEQGGVLKQILTGGGAEGIDITPDGGEVWVGNREDDTISIIDTRTDTVTGEITARGFPIRVKFTPDGGRALVSCARANRVRVFDVKSRNEIAAIETGSMPIGVLVEPSGNRAFIANSRDDTVAVVDMDTYRVLNHIRAGRTPDGLAFAGGRETDPEN